jgi:hypothetical protein
MVRKKVSTVARISNTALDSQTSHGSQLQPSLDWLSLSFFDVDVDKLVYFLSDRLNTTVYWENPKEIFERNEVWCYFQCSNGSNFGLLNRGHDRVSSVRLQLTGRSIAQWSTGYLRGICSALFEDFGAKCTRIDICVDDYERKLSFSEIWSSIENHQYSGFNKANYIESFGGKTAGKTIYFGTRRSSKFGRIYDRMGVTEGKENCIRYEVEYKRKMAEIIFLDFIKSPPEKTLECLGAILRGAFDFIIKKDKNLDRATRLKFWDDFVNRICDYAEKIKVIKKQVSIERSLSWVHRSVSKTLLVLKSALDPEVYKDTLDLWIAEAGKRLTLCDRVNIQKMQEIGITYQEIVSSY